MKRYKIEQKRKIELEQKLLEEKRIEEERKKIEEETKRIFSRTKYKCQFEDLIISSFDGTQEF